MGLVCTHASLATVEDLFRYKHEGFRLPPFPGYSPDQWGIKAHNRPWIAENGEWQEGQRIIEVGGAYSRLPEWLGNEFNVEPWIGDDFGESCSETQPWSRWGDHQELPEKHQSVTYCFSNFGANSPYHSDYFDRVFSVSTLEHIPPSQRLTVLNDIHRVLAPGGLELHTIDIRTISVRRTLLARMLERSRLVRRAVEEHTTDIPKWWDLFAASGVEMKVEMPSSLKLLDRSILVESPDVVFRFYPPNNRPKPYSPSASLTLIIRDER